MRVMIILIFVVILIVVSLITYFSLASNHQVLFYCLNETAKIDNGYALTALQVKESKTHTILNNKQEEVVLKKDGYHYVLIQLQFENLNINDYRIDDLNFNLNDYSYIDELVDFVAKDLEFVQENVLTQDTNYNSTFGQLMPIKDYAWYGHKVSVNQQYKFIMAFEIGDKISVGTTPMILNFDSYHDGGVDIALGYRK